MPVWPVVTFFGTFVSVSVSVVVLSGEDGRGSSWGQSSDGFTIRNPQSHVSVTGSTGQIVFITFVHSIQVFGGVTGNFFRVSSSIVWDGVGGISVSDFQFGFGGFFFAHVLDDHVAILFWVSSASVLSGPFDGQQ